MAVTPNYGWPVPVATDYVKDGWEAISDLGNAIDTTVAGLGSGLTLISNQTLTTSTGYSFTSLTSGKRYRILLNLTGSSNGINVTYRFRENTTDKATGYTGALHRVNEAGTQGTLGFNNSADLYTPSLHTSIPHTGSIDFQIISGTTAAINGIGYGANVTSAYYFAGYNQSMTACNGLSIYPSSGTMTGNIKLYEYE